MWTSICMLRRPFFNPCPCREGSQPLLGLSLITRMKRGGSQLNFPKPNSFTTFTPTMNISWPWPNDPWPATSFWRSCPTIMVLCSKTMLKMRAFHDYRWWWTCKHVQLCDLYNPNETTTGRRSSEVNDLTWPLDNLGLPFPFFTIFRGIFTRWFRILYPFRSNTDQNEVVGQRSAQVTE